MKVCESGHSEGRLGTTPTRERQTTQSIRAPEPAWKEHENATLYEIMVENANDQILIVQDEVVKFANIKGCKMLGYSKEELEGKNLREIVAPEEREISIRRFWSRMSGRSEHDIFEQILQAKDGRKIPTEVNASVITYRGRRADLAYARDISEKKQILQDLRESETKYRELFDSVKDVVYISNKQGKLIDINCYGLELFGYSSKQEMLSIDLATQLYVNAERRERFEATISETGYVKDFEAKFKKKDGSQIVAQITSTAIKDQDGQIIGYQGILRDISERKMREDDSKRREKELAILNHIYSIVDRSLILDDVLGGALREMIKLMQAEAAYFFLADGHSKYMLWASCGHGPTLSRELKVKPSENKLPNTPCFIQSNKKYRAFLSEELFFSSNRDSILLVPLRATNKDLGFILLLLVEGKHISTENLRLARLSANQIAGAIERAKLYSAIKEKEHRLELLSNSIINMQEEERGRISRELHDEISQALAAVEIEIEVLKNSMQDKCEHNRSFNKIKHLINETLLNIRRISLDLRPVLLDELGLNPALRWYVNDFSQRTGIEVVMKLRGIKKRLDQEREIMIFRIIQECLTNVFKHSKATKAIIALSTAGNRIIISAKDNGRGFDPEGAVTTKESSGLGLFGIRERLKIVSGNMEITSNTNQGTEVCLTIPL